MVSLLPREALAATPLPSMAPPPVVPSNESQAPAGSKARLNLAASSPIPASNAGSVTPDQPGGRALPLVVTENRSHSCDLLVCSRA